MGAWSRARYAVGDRVKLAVMGRNALEPSYRPILFTMWQAGIWVSADIDEVLIRVGITEPASGGPPRPPEPPDAPQHFPDFYDSGDLTLEALVRVVAHERPGLVVETGVANGASTRSILSRMNERGVGALYSFDIDERVLTVMRGHPGEDRWVPRIIDPTAGFAALATACTALPGPVDVWYHDSDHSYGWQTREFSLAFDLLRPGGLLISDDVDGNEAFADFVRTRGLSAVGLFDTRKVCGFVRKP